VRQMKDKPCSEYMLEVVTPRTNAARLSPAEHLFAALVLRSGGAAGDPVALEIAADSERRRFFIRTGSAVEQRRVAAILGVAYPQAGLRPSDAASSFSGDPGRPGPDEQVAVAVLRLRAGEHLPLRTLVDRDLDSAGSAQADPLLGVLGALTDLPPAWRAVSQLVVLGRAPVDWARAYQRLALERPLEQERARDTGPSLALPLGILGLIGLYLVASSGVAAWDRGDWISTLGLACGTLLLAAVAVVIARWLKSRELVDPKLVQSKIGRDACHVELRLAVFAPAFVDLAAVMARLDRLAAAYRPFSLAAGNSLLPHAVHGDLDLRVLEPFRRPCLLNVQELAGLWHLVQAGDDVPFLERTTARRRLPMPSTVGPGTMGDGCRIGVSAHQGHSVPVYLPDGLLGRHLLAVAKTRRGKSSLLLRLVQHLMQARPPVPGGTMTNRRCVVLVDPHRDLAAAALSLVPRERQTDVVYLDVSNRRRPFGINLLDAGLGWDRDQATANALRIFRREFDGFWGPRMEDAFRFAVLALFEANEALCASDPRLGRSAQHTILDVPAVLERRPFRRQVLKRTRDPIVRDWFDGYFDELDARLRLEIINPVQTKVHKYLGSRVARQIVGQPRSTVDFRQLVAEHKLVLINLNAFDVGEDVAALVGGTLLNLAARAVSAQATLAPEARQPVTLVVDEFHTLPGADYEQVLGELSKYGANMLLATQTLSRLDRLTDAQRTRDLRATVFSNLDGLFAFHTSAEDAAYLVEELGGGLDAQDLLELGDFQCYARVGDPRIGERLPTFSVRLDPPATGDGSLAASLARFSAERYGRDALDVELDLQAALQRIRGPRRGTEPEEGDETIRPEAPWPNGGTPSPQGVISGAEVPEP
jgi:DNA helicase HerA-like ATPase